MLRTTTSQANPVIPAPLSFTLKASYGKGSVLFTPDEWIPVLWRCLETIRAVQEEAHARITRHPLIGSGGGEADDDDGSRTRLSTPPSLTSLDVNFNAENDAWTSVSAPIIRPLIDMPLLASSLQVLRLAYNDRDESADLAGTLLAAAAPHLRELSMRYCGLQSLRGFLHEGGNSGSNNNDSGDRQPPSQLQKVDVYSCERLQSLDGLQRFQAWLVAVDASVTAITSLLPLATCRALVHVAVGCCPGLYSLNGLQDHPRLERVDASHTPIAGLLELQTCPALTNVDVRGCRELTSLEGLQNHSMLQEVNASLTALTSVLPLRHGCPALKKVRLEWCHYLTAAKGRLPAGVEVKR